MKPLCTDCITIGHSGHASINTTKAIATKTRADIRAARDAALPAIAAMDAYLQDEATTESAIMERAEEYKSRVYEQVQLGQAKLELGRNKACEALDREMHAKLIEVQKRSETLRQEKAAATHVRQRHADRVVCGRRRK